MSDRPQTHRRVVSYIDKSREYYAAHGYDRPYEWASYETVPFAPAQDLDLTGATVGVVTTAFPAGFSGKKQVYSLPSLPVPEAMFTQDLSWDKDATHTNDVGTFLPLAALHELAASGNIGKVAERFYGDDAATIVDMASADCVDVMMLVPL